MSSTETIVINLDRSQDRLAEFAAHNGAIGQFERFSAFEGRLLDQAALEKAGVIRPDHGLIDGALGNTLSHLTLWQRAVEQNRPLTICEDDAILNAHFFQLSEQLLGFCRDTFDIVFWGWNFDAPIFYDLFPGGGRCAAYFDQNELSAYVETFKTVQLFPSLQRVYEHYGTFCYTISPQGARKLMQKCFPIGRGKIRSPSHGRLIDIVGLDIAMNAAYPEILALASMPPIAVCRNDVSKSTVGDSARQRRKKTSSYLID